jgi:hypothetical protein
MAKHTESTTVYDAKVGTDRAVTLEIEAPQFILDCLEQGTFTPQLIAQEAFEMRDRKFTIEISVRVPKR